MARKPPPLLPFFRSGQQARLLAELFLTGEEFAGADLAETTQLTRQAVAKLLPPLVDAEVVSRRKVGKRWLYSANEHLPYYRELRTILAYTYGPPRVLREHVLSADGVRQVAIFGSWARRYYGEMGAFPRDLDVVVVSEAGSADERAVSAGIRRASEELGNELNTINLTVDEWESPARAFIKAIKDGPVLTIEKEGDPND